jgi:hypothetical protein
MCPDVNMDYNIAVSSVWSTANLGIASAKEHFFRWCYSQAVKVLLYIMINFDHGISIPSVGVKPRLNFDIGTKRMAVSELGEI